MNSNIEKFVRLAVDEAATKGAIQSKKGRIVGASFSPDKRKQTKESLVFISFVNATGNYTKYSFKHSDETAGILVLALTVATITLNSARLRMKHFRKASAIPRKRKTGSGCAFDQVEPLAKMLKQKCKKTYQTGGAPVALLLYYWMSHLEETIDDYLYRNRSEIQELIQGSQYEKIWIYDYESRNVLQKIQMLTGLEEVVLVDWKDVFDS